MTAVEIITEKGFQYVRDCSLCSGNYRIYAKPNNNDIELYVKKSGDYVKIYKKGRQVVMTNVPNLLNALQKYGIS